MCFITTFPYGFLTKDIRSLPSSLAVLSNFRLKNLRDRRGDDETHLLRPMTELIRDTDLEDDLGMFDEDLEVNDFDDFPAAEDDVLEHLLLNTGYAMVPLRENQELYSPFGKRTSSSSPLTSSDNIAYYPKVETDRLADVFDKGVKPGHQGLFNPFGKRSRGGNEVNYPKVDVDRLKSALLQPPKPGSQQFYEPFGKRSEGVNRGAVTESNLRKFICVFARFSSSV